MQVHNLTIPATRTGKDGKQYPTTYTRKEQEETTTTSDDRTPELILRRTQCRPLSLDKEFCWFGPIAAVYFSYSLPKR